MVRLLEGGSDCSRVTASGTCCRTCDCLESAARLVTAVTAGSAAILPNTAVNRCKTARMHCKRALLIYHSARREALHPCHLTVNNVEVSVTICTRELHRPTGIYFRGIHTFPCGVLQRRLLKPSLASYSLIVVFYSICCLAGCPLPLLLIAPVTYFL